MAKRYYIATQHGYLDQYFLTKNGAIKALAEEVRLSAAKCRRSERTCSVVGSARSGSVEIRIGGRQGHNLWQRYVINRR